MATQHCPFQRQPAGKCQSSAIQSRRGSNLLKKRIEINHAYSSTDFDAWLLERLAVKSGEHVLDVGCGAGAQSIPIAGLVGPSGRRWYELYSAGHRISYIQRHAIQRTMPWIAATLDGLVKETGAVFEAKFMLP
jgi:hypothetical protein